MVDIRKHMDLFGDGIFRERNNLNTNTIIASVDEVGRGCLFGPVVACAVILKDGFELDSINDSKKLSEKKRLSLSSIIKENCVSYSIVEISNDTIDDINILQATMLAMEKCILSLNTKPEHILVDGNYFKTGLKIPYTTVVKGDATYQSIAAASILAKVYRDELMIKLSEIYPGYGIETNMGYGTKKHKQAIKELGLTDLHRKTFKIK